MIRPLVVAALLIAGLAPASAQPRENRDRALANTCPPGLKFAAGACLRRCPPGFSDRGRVCRQKQQDD